MKKMMSGVLVVAAMLMTGCGGPIEEQPAQVDAPESTTNALDCNSNNFCRYDSQCGVDGVCYKGRCACI
jgi:predicted small lipoprotein YifL